MKEKITKGKLYCLISAGIIFGAYIAQRILNMTLEPTKTGVLVQAIVFSTLTAVVYFLVAKSDEPFYGILAAIFGIRMLPPNITGLGEFSPQAELLYYFVQKASFVIFAFAIVKLYELQKRPRMIKPIPILCTILIVPFFNEISVTVNNFIMEQSGNMLYSYFASFAIYSAAMICLLFVGTRCSKVSAALICDFQLVALLLNAGRKICAIIIHLANSAHISRSYYCWVVIYGFFFIAFYVLRKHRKTAIV